MPAPRSPTVTFFELEKGIRNDEIIPPAKRRVYCSALKRFAEIAGRSMSDILAEPASVRVLNEKASWQLAGLSKGGWANLKSNVTAAMKSQGIRVDRRCRRNLLCSPAWEEMLANLPERDRRDLRRFAGWCSSLQIRPAEISQEVFERYLAYLETASTQRNPKERWHVARRSWNRALACDGEKFPVIHDTRPQGWRALTWSDLPGSLGLEVAAYEKAMDRQVGVKKIRLSKQPKALSPVTVRNYVNALRWHLSHLVEDGVSAERFGNLAACVDPVMAERGLERRLRERELGERTKGSLSAIANALISFARFAEVPEDVLQELKDIADHVRHRPVGMCARNVERLSRLRQPEVQKRFVNLPFDVARRLRGLATPTCREAQEMQMAALLKLLQHMPLRIANAAGLDLEDHVIRPQWRILIPAHEVKNGMELTRELGEKPAEILDLYIDTFRPVLKPECSALFVTQSGTRKGASALSKQLSAFIRRELGITVNAHLLRHWVAFVYLDANPGDYETVRQFLGHKSITTTIAFYTGLETESAHKRLDSIISSLRYQELNDQL